jgi:hypothetical protein
MGHSENFIAHTPLFGGFQLASTKMNFTPHAALNRFNLLHSAATCIYSYQPVNLKVFLNNFLEKNAKISLLKNCYQSIVDLYHNRNSSSLSKAFSTLSWQLTCHACTLATQGYLAYGLILLEYPTVFTAILTLDLLSCGSEYIDFQKDKIAQIKKWSSFILFLGILAKCFDYTPSEWLNHLQTNTCNTVGPLILTITYTLCSSVWAEDIVGIELIFILFSFYVGEPWLPASLQWRFLLSIILPTLTWLIHSLTDDRDVQFFIK